MYKTKETLTSTSCGNDKQQRGRKKGRAIVRDGKKKKHLTVFILLPFSMQTVGWFITVTAAVKLSALSAR